MEWRRSMYVVMVCVVVVLVSVYAKHDRGKEMKREYAIDDDALWFMIIGLLLWSIATYQHRGNGADDFKTGGGISKLGMLEWKGWMQVGALLQYLLFSSNMMMFWQSVVSMYLFVSGYGHTMWWIRAIDGGASMREKLKLRSACIVYRLCLLYFCMLAVGLTGDLLLFGAYVTLTHIFAYVTSIIFLSYRPNHPKLFVVHVLCTMGTGALVGSPWISLLPFAALGSQNAISQAEQNVVTKRTLVEMVILSLLLGLDMDTRQVFWVPAFCWLYSRFRERVVGGYSHFLTSAGRYSLELCLFKFTLSEAVMPEMNIELIASLTVLVFAAHCAWLGTRKVYHDSNDIEVLIFAPTIPVCSHAVSMFLIDPFISHLFLRFVLRLISVICVELVVSSCLTIGQNEGRKWLRNGCVVFLLLFFVVGSGAITKSVIETKADSHCKNVLASARWLNRECLPQSSSSRAMLCEVDAFESGWCGLHHFDSFQTKSLLREKNIVFVGDSVVRFVFYAFRMILDTDIGFPRAPYHSDISFTSNDEFDIHLSFKWAPYAKDLDSNLFNSINGTKVADILVIGNGLWDALHVHDPSKYREEMEQAMEIMNSSLQSSTLTAWLECTRVVPSKLLGEEKQRYLNPKATQRYRSIVQDLLGRSRIENMIGQSRSMFDLYVPMYELTAPRSGDNIDGVHYSHRTYLVMAQVLLNQIEYHIHRS